LFLGWWGEGQRKILAASKNEKNALVEYKPSYRREHYSYRVHIFWQAPLTPLLLDSLYRQMVFQYLLTGITSN
jgi:predicted alpha-1,6-mannanase (GH76 family)